MEKLEFMKKLIGVWQKDSNNKFYVEPENFEFEKLKGFNMPLKKKDSIILLNEVVNMSMLKTFTPRKDDVFIIGVPKSG